MKIGKRSKTLSQLVIGVSALSLAAEVHAATEIDVLVLYTPGTAEIYNGAPETRINHLFNVANQVYKDSNVDLVLRPVHSQLVNYPDSTNSVNALQDMTYHQVAAFTNVEALRTEYGADMVLLYRPYSANHGSCGVAWVGGYNTNGNMSGFQPYMYSHVSVSTCGDYVTAHELGHNMGLNHSRLQDGTGGTLPYALGHGVQNNFVTIMAYQSAFNVDYWDGKIYKFSSPNLTCNGLPCGVDKSNALSGADAVTALGITTPQIANFFPSKNVDDTGGGDTVLSELEQKLRDLEEAQSNYDQLLSDYYNAIDYSKATKLELQQGTAELKQEKMAYNAAKKQYKKTATVLRKAQSRLARVTLKGDEAVIQAAQEAVTAAIAAYDGAVTAYTAAQESLQAQLDKVALLKSEYKLAVQAMKVAKTTLNAGKKELLIAQKAYKKALNAA